MLQCLTVASASQLSLSYVHRGENDAIILPKELLFNDFCCSDAFLVLIKFIIREAVFGSLSTYLD